MTDTTHDVLGIGNAIVDVLAHADDAFLDDHGMPKGSMTLIDADRAESLYAAMTPVAEISGGSAANTIAGLASLGGRGAYIGKIREDALGQAFRSHIRMGGVTFETTAATDGPPTARCLIFVTPDAQRTMQTFLGASATLAPSDLDGELIRGAAITYLEGYLFDPPPAKQAFLEAARVAHEAGRRVALTLSDSFCVERHRDDFLEFIDGHVDLLFGNEDELISLFRADDLAAAVEALRGRAPLAAITRGAQGSIVLDGRETIEVAADPVESVVDTTGAGDLYAAGFMHGLSSGRDLATCARLGGITAGDTIGRIGARPERPLSDVVAERLGAGEGAS